MTLFFETGRQAGCFLAALPLGFAIAACLCCGQVCGLWRLMADLALLLAGGVALIMLLVIVRDGSLRMYHFLGAACGALLYLRGVEAVRKGFVSRMRQKRKRKNKTPQAGIDIPENENI